MKELIPILNQGADFLVDSRKVAKLFDITTQHLRERIEEFKTEMEPLGHLRFETGNGIKRKQGGGKQEKYYWLNFDHLIFLLFRTRPTEEIKKFHVPLILAFRNAREKRRPIDNIMLSIPEKWKLTFKEEFYAALLALYGQQYDASKNKQSWVGRWTNVFIYQPIFDSLPSELKSKRKAYCGETWKDADFIKLHQFLEDNAKEQLKERIAKTTAVLQMSGSKQDFKENYLSVFHGQTQINWDDDFGDDAAIA